MPHIRTSITVFCAIAALTASLGAGAASAASTGKPIVLTMESVTIHGKELPIHIYASGAITAAGIYKEVTEHGGVDRITLRFPKGRLFVTARENLDWVPNLADCLAKGRGIATWKVTGGTGAYRNASGGGTYRDSGTLLGAHGADGKCLGRNAAPPFVVVTADLVGTLALPAA